MEERCVPLRKDLEANLAASELLQIIEAASPIAHCTCNVPPVLPVEGELYIFDLGSVQSLWEDKKRKFRCDQYRWVPKGVYQIKCQSYVLKKRSNSIDSALLGKDEGDDRFRRWEYWGYENYFIMHYTGDHTVFNGFSHRSSSKSRPFIRSSPYVKEKVQSCNPLQPVNKLYRDLVSDDNGGPRHCVMTPRNHEQVKNAKDELSREFRFSHDALFNTYRLCYQLKFLNKKGEPKDFLSHFTLHPRLILHLMPEPILENLKQLLLVNTDPTILHYDTVFNIGDFYMSILTFRHHLFKSNPVIPCAFLIHSRRFHSDHKIFLDSIIQAVPQLIIRHINIVTDREFKFASNFPVGYHLFCWNHFETDLLWQLRHSYLCNADESNYFVNVFRKLQQIATEEEFNREWHDVKGSNQFADKPNVTKYFEENILPAFKCHAAIWMLKSAGIADAENGITNNPSESMNAVIHRLKQWKNVPLDVIIASMFHLCEYYQREIERSLHCCGQYELKAEYNHLGRNPSLLPFFPPSINPNDIVDKVFTNISKHVSSVDIPILETKKPTMQQSSEHSDCAHFVGSTQLDLAHAAITNKRVSLSPNGFGAWIVIETDGTTPCAVKLFPKEACSCSSKVTCYHILACRLMVGLAPEEKGKINLGELHKGQRKKNERPAGRKRPRKGDFELTEDKTLPVHQLPNCNETIQSKVTCPIGKSSTQLSDKKVENWSDTISSFSAMGDNDCEIKEVKKCFNPSNTDMLSTCAYLDILSSRRSCNVCCDRILLVGNPPIMWSDYLSIIAQKFPGVLHTNYVNTLSLHEVLSPLNMMSISIVQTCKSKQVAFFRRLNDKDGVPEIQIVSAYDTPDKSELNYHAGVSLNLDGDRYIAVHSGVQFSKQLGEADVLLAGMLYSACRNSEDDISKVRFHISKLRNEIESIVCGQVKEISVEFENGLFCKEKKEVVEINCLCRSPWIEGTTSKALYGDRQKEFDAHICVKCDKWYHKYCLTVSGILLPKRNHDFVCPNCTIPQTIPWSHLKYTNTCTSDNILTIILLHCNQHPGTLDQFGSSNIENALKCGITAMMAGDVVKGKGIVLDYIATQLNLTQSDSKISLYGSEYDICLKLFRHVWKLSLELKCNSPCCPNPLSSRYPVSFNFQSSSSEQFLDQIKMQFPSPGDLNSYCGARFIHSPPPTACYDVCLQHDISSQERVEIFECKGTTEVLHAKFISKFPWMIPFCISSFGCTDICRLIKEVPKVVNLYGKTYVLAGLTLFKDAHYTSVIYWRGKVYFYDGMGTTENLRFMPLDLCTHLEGQDGSFAIFIML